MENRTHSHGFEHGYYRNNKNQRIYQVIDVVINTTNKDNEVLMVLYYGLENPFRKFVRELEEFKEKFELCAKPSSPQ